MKIIIEQCFNINNRKHFLCFLSSYRNASGCLGEREMLWEHEPHASVSTTFSSSPNFHECFYNSIETWRKCFLFLLENSLPWLMPMTTTTFLCFFSSYRNTIFNQSACIFSLGYFLSAIIKLVLLLYSIIILWCNLFQVLPIIIFVTFKKWFYQTLNYSITVWLLQPRPPRKIFCKLANENLTSEQWIFTKLIMYDKFSHYRSTTNFKLRLFCCFITRTLLANL